MSQGKTSAGRDEALGDEGRAFGCQFKYALIIYAVVEFVAIALVVYYKLSR